jgi:hypothetical protein
MSQKQQPPELLLRHHLKALRLPTVLREYPRWPTNVPTTKPITSNFC